MKKFFAAFLSILLLSGPALAGWNLRQKADGTAEWMNGKGDTAPLGSVYLTVRMADVNTASTAGVPIPITAAHIGLVQAMLMDEITTAKVTFVLHRMSSQTPSVSFGEVTNYISTDGARLGFLPESATHTVTTFEPVRVWTASPYTNITDYNAVAVTNFFEKNDVLVIESLGESTATGSTSPAIFVIRIDQSR